MARHQSLSPKNIIETSSLWNVLTAEQQVYLAHNFQITTFKKNAVIYSENEQPNSLLCVISGKVKIYKEGNGGRSQIVRIIKPEEFFGYRALFAGEKYVTTAAAFEACVIYEIPEPVILNLIKNNADLAFSFIQFLSIDLGISDARSVVLTQKHIRGRLAESLIHIKEHYGTEENDKTLLLKLSREDLANLSNMTTSNAIRTLSLFSKEKLIAIEGRKIKIIDEERLRRISKFE